MFNPKLNLRRYSLIVEFYQNGFRGLCSFYNICKDFKINLTDFQIIEFYKGTRYDDDSCGKVEAVLSALKRS